MQGLQVAVEEHDPLWVRHAAVDRTVSSYAAPFSVMKIGGRPAWSAAMRS